MNLQERIEQYLNKNLDESVTFESSKNVLSESQVIIKNAQKDKFKFQEFLRKKFIKGIVGVSLDPETNIVISGVEKKDTEKIRNFAMSLGYSISVRSTPADD